MVKIYFILILLFVNISHGDDLHGHWKMTRNQTFENILTSQNFQMNDEEQQIKLAETFSKIINGYFYEFKKDTVIFTDFKDSEIIQLKGKWWVDKDTLYIGRFDKISIQKYLISKLEKDVLQLRIIMPSDGYISKNIIEFKKNEFTQKE